MNHIDLTPDLITAAVGVVSVVIATYFAFRRFGPDQAKVKEEKEFLDAQQANERAERAASWIDTYNKMYGIITQRDEDIQVIKKQYFVLKDEFEEYKTTSKAVIAEERKSRKLAESERDTLRESISELEASFVKHNEERDVEIGVLRKEVETLRTLVDKLTKDLDNGRNNANPDPENA